MVNHDVGRTLRLFPLLATVAAPAAAQVPTDRPVGQRPPAAVALDPFAGRRVAAIEIAGIDVTKEWVITREIRTRVGEPLDLHEVARDVARLDNLSIFAEIRVDGSPVGDDSVRLVCTVKEMPSWFPVLSYVYTEENGLSWGADLSAGNLAGRDLSFSARVYFGDLEQQWSRISWPWIGGNHLLRIGGSVGWDTRDSWRNPRRGWQNELELWHTGGFLGGDGDCPPALTPGPPPMLDSRPRRTENLG
jgi:outer membrane protein assembly factor BamA